MTRTSPIQHIVIIVKENHTFDNYFGTFPGANGMALPPVADPQHEAPPHYHRVWLERAQRAVREQYTEAAIPGYFAYARLFTLCDNYFTDVGGPSTPNHLMLITADSPIVDNPHGNPVFPLPSLPDRLVQAGLTWRNYGGYAFQYIAGLRGSPNNVDSTQFVTDARAGKLPNVSWLYAPEGVNLPPGVIGLSEHPPDDVTAGMQWTIDQVNAVVDGGLWPSAAIFITWDDYGGWYDHVDPPHVEDWQDATWFRYGSRVGCLVLSPYALRGHISKQLHSHVSLVAFCEHTFGLAPLTQRDGTTDPMSDCFDFGQQPLPPPPHNPVQGSTSSSSTGTRGSSSSSSSMRPTSSSSSSSSAETSSSSSSSTGAGSSNPDSSSSSRGSSSSMQVSSSSSHAGSSSTSSGSSGGSSSSTNSSSSSSASIASSTSSSAPSSSSSVGGSSSSSGTSSSSTARSTSSSSSSTFGTSSTGASSSSGGGTSTVMSGSSTPARGKTIKWWLLMVTETEG